MTSEIPRRLVEIGRSFDQAYRPVLAFSGWKVAMLRYFEAVDPRAFHRVERHLNTNEVFVLTAGEADLIVCDGDDAPTTFHVVKMETSVAYNVQRSVWHHVVMSRDAHVVLFEREETSAETTEYAELAAEAVEAVAHRLAIAGSS